MAAAMAHLGLGESLARTRTPVTFQPSDPTDVAVPQHRAGTKLWAIVRRLRASRIHKKSLSAIAGMGPIDPPLRVRGQLCLRIAKGERTCPKVAKVEAAAA